MQSNTGKINPSLEKEKRRLQELTKLQLLNSPDEESFDRITELASEIFAVPIALITLITEDQQWFKSCSGLHLLEHNRSTEREAAFCQVVIEDEQPLVVQDTYLDERFSQNRLVLEYGIRFYAGVPITTKNNNILGSLCLLDIKPRDFSETDLKRLKTLGDWVKTEIDLKADLREKELSERSKSALYEITSQHPWSFDKKVESLLELARTRLDVPHGIYTKLEDDAFEILQYSPSLEKHLRTGNRIPRGETFAGEVARVKETLYIQDTTITPWTSIPFQKQFNIKEYLGIPIFVNDHVYGTICFFSNDYNFIKRSSSEIKFVQLIGQWIGKELERIQADEELRVSEKRFEQVAENIKEVIFIKDILQKQVLYISPAFEEIWGHSCESYRQDYEIWEKSLYPDDAPEVLEKFKQLKDRLELEYRIVLPDGRLKWIRDRVFAIYNEAGLIERITGIAEDITESKLSEELFRKFDKISAVGQLAASFAHEIRNPLTTVKGFLQFEQGGPYKDLMLSEISRIELIIQEFLMLAKPHHESNFEIRDVEQLLKDVIMLQEPQANLYNIQFEIQIEDELPMVNCEENQIKQVLINIINNAVEAMPNGGIISIRLYKASEQNVSFEIIDQGVGIPTDRLSKLGEPFYSNKEKGTGLGLMVSYRIMENHRGQIHIQSELQKGTTVTISLPIE